MENKCLYFWISDSLFNLSYFCSGTVSSPYSMRKPFVILWIKSSGFGLNYLHLCSINLSPEGSGVKADAFQVVCILHRYSSFYSGNELVCKITFALGYTYFSFVYYLQTTSGTVIYRNTKTFLVLSKNPNFKMQYPITAEGTVFKYAELSLQYEICLFSWHVASKRLMGCDTFSLVCLFPVQGLLFNTNYYFRSLVKVSKIQMVYIYILNIYIRRHL